MATQNSAASNTKFRSYVKDLFGADMKFKDGKRQHEIPQLCEGAFRSRHEIQGRQTATRKPWADTKACTGKLIPRRNYLTCSYYE